MTFLDRARFRWVVALSIMAMVVVGSWMPAAAAEVSTPVTGSESQQDASSEAPDEASRILVNPTDEPEGTEAAGASVMSEESDRNTTLEITLRDTSGRDFLFPTGQAICLGVTVTPDSGAAPIVLRPCFDKSSSVPALWAGLPHPDTATYAVTLVSNSTTCTGITIPPISFADYGGGGWFAIFHVTMTCPDAPPPPEEPPADALYDALRINYVNDGAPADLPGTLCFRIRTDPVVPRSPFDTCTRTATFSYSWIGTATTPLPVTATYTAAELRNESGCEGTPQPLRAVTQDDGSLIAEIDVLVRCGPPTPTEAVLETLTLRFDDRSGAPITTYPGEVCIAVTADPPIAALDLRGPVCASVTSYSATWSSSDVVRLPVTTTYTASTVSNATGCEVEIDPAVVERSDDDVYSAVIQAWITCEEEPVPSPTPTPGATGTATATAPTTATSMVTATATTSATSSPTSMATGTAAHGDPTRTATRPPGDDPSSGSVTATEPVDHNPAGSSTAAPLVTMLPSTGVGSSLPSSLWLVIAAIVFALAGGMSVIVIDRRR